MMNKPVIQVDELSGGYGETVILNNISFNVYEKEIFVILGGSGSGKSTLLRHLIGLEKPMKGKITIDNINIASCDENQIQMVFEKIGILFQSSALLGSMTVAENIALPLVEKFRNIPVSMVDNLVNFKLKQVGLEKCREHLPSELSGGMKKRAGIARALIKNPKILFFDEPSAGLDPITSAGLDQLILKLNRILGVTVVMVTNELESIYTLAHRVIMVEKGKGIIAEGTPKFLKENSADPFVKRFFNRQSEEIL